MMLDHGYPGEAVRGILGGNMRRINESGISGAA